MIKIAIIKLGAKGDVIRTLPILIEIKKKYPNSIITWITKKNISDIVYKSPYVDEVLTLPVNLNKNFDILYNFDIETKATDLANQIKALKKYGFYSENEFAMAFNVGSEYYLNTLFDDNIKKTNIKTYQEMMFDVAELPYKKQHHPITLTIEDLKYGEDFLNENNLDESKLIGIHIGSAPRWPSKQWHEDNIINFIKIAKTKGYKILLFSGPHDAEKQKKLLKNLKNEKITIYPNNPKNTNLEFLSLIYKCAVMVCSDSFALHASLALKKPAVGLFFCTSSNEIEDYGLLKKINSPFLYDFFPEKMDEYNEKLVKSISPEKVLSEIENLLNEKRVVNALIEQNGKFLVIERKEGIHMGKWAFPGGIVERGETDEDTLRRELREETGLTLKDIIRKISDFSYVREDGSLTLGTCYLASVENTDIILNGEILDFKWVDLEEFNNLDHIPGLEEEALNALCLMPNKNK